MHGVGRLVRVIASGANSKGFGSGRIRCFFLDPDPVFKFFWTRIRFSIFFWIRIRFQPLDPGAQGVQKGL